MATRQIKAAFPRAGIVAVTVRKGNDIKEAARASAYVVKDNLPDLRRTPASRADNLKASNDCKLMA